MIRFGRGEVDVAARVVRLDGEPRHLEPQAFDLLAYLLAHRERVVPKAELLDEVWGDQFVSESALTTRVKEIRQVLGDNGARQAVIKNFRGRGYRFVASIDHRRTPQGAASASPTSTLVGRNADLDAIGELLDTSPLVTLVGPGGVGKTSLAREIARRQRYQRSGGALVVRLAQLRDADNVVHALRRDTDLLDTDSDDDLLGAIADLDALVVVDNCEHVIDETSRLLADILARAPRVRLLATSRERTGLPGEQVWPVAPLDLQAARDLLLRRARAADPDYGWTPDDHEDIDRLLDTLDRLPLAIEMAASRLPSIGVVELADLLGRRVDLLRSPDRSADERHRSVGALIEWSEDLLTDEERHVLVGLSTFAGPVAIDDLAAIVDSDPTALAVGPLARLVDHSLVVAETLAHPTRHRLLETVRASVAPRRPAELDTRHAHHIVGAVADADRALRSPDEAIAAARVDSLLAEIRLAHGWARDHEPLLAAALTTAIGHYAHERQLVETAAWASELLPHLDPADQATLGVLAALGADASNRGDYDRAHELAAQAVDSHDHRVRGSAHDTLANLGLYTGDLEAARRHGRALFELGAEHGDPALFALGVSSLVLGCVYSGRLDHAEELLGLRHQLPAASITSLAWLAYTEAELLAAQERYAEAIVRFGDAIDLGQTVGGRFVIGVAQVSQLSARTRSGSVAEAKAAFVPLLRHYRRVHSTTHGITALRNLVELLVTAHDDRHAMVVLGALSSPAIKSTYGTESERIADARAEVEGRVGAETVDAWVQEGSTHDALWALDHAIEVLTA